MTISPNKLAAGKAGIALRFQFERHCPGLPEPDRLPQTGGLLFDGFWA